MTQESADKDGLRGSEAFWKLVIVGCALMWGLSFTITKSMIELVSPMWVITFRFVPASLCMALPLLPRLRDPANRQTIVAGAGLGVMLWIAYVLQVWGLTVTTASKGSFLCGIYAVIIPFVAWVLGSGRPRYRSLVAAALCLAGLALVSLNDDFSVGLGDVACVGCSVFVAIETYFLPLWGGGRDSAVLSTSMFCVVGLLSLVFALVADPLPGPEAFTPGAIATWVYLSLGCTLVAIGAMNEAFMHVDPVPGSLLSSLESPLGTVAAVTLGGEVLSGRLVSGFALIACAVVVSEAGDLLLTWARRLLGKGTA